MKIETVQVESNPEITIVKLEGRLDAHPAEDVEEILMEQINKGSQKLIIDLENVDYLGSSGIRVFLAAKKKLNDVNGQLKLLKMSSAGIKILKAMEIDKMFEIFDDIEEAIKSFT